MKRNQYDATANAVPDFGPTVRRERLLKTIAATRHDLLVLAAPSGYGKSVLAAQVASELHDDVVWIALRGQSSRPAGVARVIARRLGAGVPEDLPDSPFPVSPNAAQFLVTAGEAAKDRPGESLCLVLDDLASPATTILPDLTRALCGNRRQRVMLIATMRDLEDTRLGRDSCVLEAPDLRLSHSELAALVQGLGVESAGQSDIDHLLELTAGHPALAAVLSRHDMVGPCPRLHGRRASRDVRGLLVDLAVEQLDIQELRLLYFTALLGSVDEALLGRVVMATDRRTLERAADCIPLFSVGRTPTGATLRMHDLAREAFVSPEFVALLPDADTLMHSALEFAADVGDETGVFEIAVHSMPPADISAWLQKHGRRLVDGGNVAAVDSMLKRLRPADLLHPRLALLAAQVACERELVEEALRRASVARRLAEAEGDDATVVAALLLASRTALTVGQVERAASVLNSVLDGNHRRHLDDETLVSARAVASMTCALSGDVVHAAAHIGAVRELLRCCNLSAETTARALNYEAFVEAVCLGRAASAHALIVEALRCRPLSAVTSCYLLGNRAGTLFEMGRVRRAEEAYREVQAHQEVYALEGSAAAFLAVDAALRAARGETELALSLSQQSVDECRQVGDDCSYLHNILYRAAIALSAAEGEVALGDAEAGLETAVQLGLPLFENLAAVQMRAALLALGDPVAAAHVEGSRVWALEHRAAHVALLADCVLAEIDRLDGRSADGVARLRGHRDYILTESANWLLAMYCRAFPGLLGIAASAVGAEKLPTHLLKMVLPEHAASAMPVARETMSPEAWRTLARRMGYSAKKGESTARRGDRTGPGDCRVRFFGGFEVTTAEGPIPDRVWRKRKARALFAMLVAARGKDVPREVLLEALWPGMDEERARNNLYVTWAAMKNALAPMAPKGGSCPYVETFAGVCRALPGVASDIDEFDEAVVCGRKAERSGDVEAALDAYDRIAEIYRGDLMSGDLYDDWCSQLRDRYRHEFGDAMLAAARLRAERGEPERALQTIRVALVHDAWREDLYQAALTYQIACGQRSAAIETYMTCRTRLAEDLGLDPSLETRRLYDRILAMEGPPTDEPAA